MDADIWDRAFYDDGEWVSWSDVEEQLRYHEWRAKYPSTIRSLIPYFQELLSLAQSYHLETGRHLNVYGDIGELFGVITYGIRLNKNYAQGADGRLGNDQVEIKTFSRSAYPLIKSSNASRLSPAAVTSPAGQPFGSRRQSGLVQMHRAAAGS